MFPFVCRKAGRGNSPSCILTSKILRVSTSATGSRRATNSCATWRISCARRSRRICSRASTTTISPSPRGARTSRCAFSTSTSASARMSWGLRWRSRRASTAPPRMCAILRSSWIVRRSRATASKKPTTSRGRSLTPRWRRTSISAATSSARSRKRWRRGISRFSISPRFAR